MTDITTLRSRLNEAESALHTLTVGNKPVRITVDGHTTEYTPTRAPDLRIHIADLKNQIAAASGSPRRPIYMSF